MKTMVYVLVPPEVAAGEISRWVDKILVQHVIDLNLPSPNGRFDYLVGPLSEEQLNDPVTLGRLPSREKRSLSGRICEVSRLPPERVPGALVTPDGIWHDLGDFGWRFAAHETAENQQAIARWTTRYRELISQHPWHLVVEVWAHS